MILIIFIDPNNFEKEFETVDAANQALCSIVHTMDWSFFPKPIQLLNAATHQEKVNCIYEAIHNYVIAKNLIDEETLFALNPDIKNAIGTSDALLKKEIQLREDNRNAIDSLKKALEAKSFISEFSKYNVDRENYSSDEEFKVADKAKFKDRVRKLFDKIKGPYLAKEYCGTITVDDKILDSMYESMYNIKKSLGKTSLEQNDMKISITDEIRHYLQVFINCLVKLKNLVFSTESELVKSNKELKNNVIGKYEEFIINTREKVGNITRITF